MFFFIAQSVGMLLCSVTAQGGNGNRFTSASNAFIRYAVLWDGNGWMPTFSGFRCPQMVNYYFAANAGTP